MIGFDAAGERDACAQDALEGHPQGAVSRYEQVPAHGERLRWLVEEAAAVAAVPKAAISVVSATTQRTLASVGVDITVLPREHSLCSRIIDEGRVVHVRDASRDPRWTGHPFVDGRWGRTRFIGAHPLVAADGMPVGLLCVMDLRPRVLDDEQVAALERLVPRVLTALEVERAEAARRPRIHAS